MFFGCKHKWKTVAIDTGSVTWHYVRDPDRSFEHILLYQECERCGERQMDYDDAHEAGRKYAAEGSDAVARMRSIWIHSGDIPVPHNSDKLKYIDPKYAPHGSFEKWLRALKVDPSMEDLLKQQMVDDALGQLEVAVKLYANNMPKETEQ